jgi:hypothetical protein
VAYSVGGDGGGKPPDRSSGEFAIDLLTSAQRGACAEFLPLRNRGFGTLAVTVLPIPFARKGRRYRVRRRATDNVFSSSCFEQTIPRG